MSGITKKGARYKPKKCAKCNKLIIASNNIKLCSRCGAPTDQIK